MGGALFGLYQKLAVPRAFRPCHRRLLDLLFRALKFGDAARVAPIDKLSVVFVFIFAVLFLGDRLTLSNWLGAAMIAGGAVLVAYRA